ncbi:4,5-dihydroxyphthalate decarboxylase [Rhizobium sp. BK529]|uniref:phosphate ABC transporter substrate-binding protein n=1 Tax=unclassified Rhizobium TaxID=2613769 RepID=UPI00104F54EB|nr:MULTISPECIES: phosphate ABC transporter substrate-binding protein [unclassified Rhizobium]MBB3595838.1 4,5-dihydroxyphthalate decarboxylase [Rhizobium sp. BK529]TCR95137.1 4,5-dihydroxyphthalate decarboxylase [Rhizobium sp. BK418]
MSDKLLLRTALGKHAHVKPLVDGRVSSSRVTFEFRDYDPLPKAFRTMVRGDELDVSELAVVTHLLAHHYAKPLRGIAIPLWNRLPHANLVCPVDSAIREPKDLNNTKVGVRAYAQTSGVWVRGIIKDDYGVDLDSITWLTMEDAHLSEYTDPANTVRNDRSMGLRELMMTGELSAIMGERVVDPSGIRTVVPEGDKAAEAWIERTGIVPINHVLTVRNALLDAYPWLAGELMELFEEARRVSIEEDGATPPPAYGLEANRRSLQLAFDYSADQQVTPRRYEVDALFVRI